MIKIKQSVLKGKIKMPLGWKEILLYSKSHETFTIFVIKTHRPNYLFFENKCDNDGYANFSTIFWLDRRELEI